MCHLYRTLNLKRNLPKHGALKSLSIPLTYIFFSGFSIYYVVHQIVPLKSTA